MIQIDSYRIGQSLRFQWAAAWRLVMGASTGTRRHSVVVAWRHRRRTRDRWRRRWQAESPHALEVGARRGWTEEGARRRLLKAVVAS